jgi:hypothetical protein
MPELGELLEENFCKMKKANGIYQILQKQGILLN